MERTGWPLGLGVPEGSETPTGVHMQVTTHACRKMEAWMRYSPQKQIETDEGNIMELTTDEIIARLMNLSVKLDGEMRFEEGSTVSQAIACIMTLRNSAERLRHPSNVSNNDELKAVIEWIVENPS
jgi:hypothetical protein